MTLLILGLACDGTHKSDSPADSNAQQTETGQTDSADSGQDSDTGTDSGTDSGTSAAAWIFSDERSLVSAIEPAAAPAYIAGLLDGWLKYGPDGPNCPNIVDQGSGTVLLDGTACANGSIEGKVTLTGLADGQLPTDSPVGLNWDNFGSTYGLYLVHGVTGAQILTRNADGTSRVQTTDLKIHFDSSLPRLVPSQIQWGGDYHYSSLDSTEGAFHAYGTITGSYDNPEYGELTISWNYKFSAGSCEESFYYPAAGIWTGAQELKVSWDGDSHCDGCVPYTLGELREVSASSLPAAGRLV